MTYILYCRKSSEAEDKQVLSIDSQEAELRKLAVREGFTISKVYKESMSAKASGRPVFDEMLKHIEKKKDCVLLAWKLDRVARNMVDGGRVIELMDRGFIKEIRTYEKTWRNIPEDKFMMTLDFGIAKKYVDDLSVNVKRGNRMKLERGGWLGRAPMGYLNDRVTKTIVINEKTAPFIHRAFELYATGGYSLLEVSEKLYEQGLRTLQGNKVHRGAIHKLLKDPVYMGIVFRLGKYHQGAHVPIVSKDLYDQANDVLTGKLHPKKKKHFFHLRGFLKCASCGCALTATKKKGHDYYYCTNGKGKCVEHKTYLRAEKLDELVAETLTALQSDPELVELAYEASKERLNLDSRYAAASLGNLQERLSALEDAQSRLTDKFVSEVVPEAVYEAKMWSVGNEIVALKTQISKLQGVAEEGCATLEPVKKVFMTGNTAVFNYLKGNSENKRILVQELLWNLSIKNQKVQEYQFKNEYAILAKDPKPSDISEMLRDRDSNPDSTLQRRESYH